MLAWAEKFFDGLVRRTKSRYRTCRVGMLSPAATDHAPAGRIGSGTGSRAHAMVAGLEAACRRLGSGSKTPPVFSRAGIRASGFQASARALPRAANSWHHRTGAKEAPGGA